MKKILLVISTIALLVSLALSVNAHPGRTDGDGGHTDRSTGEYHYHHGYSAHDHYDIDGDGDLDCPYNFMDKTDRGSGSSDRINHGSSDRTSKGISSPTRKDTEDAASIQESHTITFFEFIKAMLSLILPAICIWIASSYLLSFIFFIFFEKSNGCTVSLILGGVISLISYVWLIIASLT